MRAHAETEPEAEPGTERETARVYLRPEEFAAPPAPYRTGEAGLVWLGGDGEIETDLQVVLSANSTHALLGHGVVDALNRLPLEGVVGQRTDVLIPHAELEDAQAVFYEADRKTYGGSWEFLAGPHPEREGIECWVRIVNREYQRTLSKLTFLLGSASRAGRAVRVRM
jgi:hypothetical protein